MKKLVVGLLAHVDAGKTTLAESLLYTAGTIRNQGRVDKKDTFLDTDAMEKDRGITIFSKQARLTWKDTEVTILDTPGHVDFSSEMERTLSVLDAAVLVISGSEGVQGHTRTLWKLLEYYGVPVFIFVNKMDQPDTDSKLIMGELAKKLGGNFVDMSGDRDTVIEEFSASSEELIEEFLESGKLSQESIINCFFDRGAFPVWFGSALYNDGVQPLLDALDEYGIFSAGGEEETEQFGARVFKITRDEQGKRLTHLKVTSGKLLPKMLVGEEKVDQIRAYNGKKYEPLSEAVSGQVVAVTGLSETFAGQGLGIDSEQVFPYLAPVLSYKLFFPNGEDPVFVYGKLKPLEEEFPELSFSWNERHKEISVNVNGEIQIQVLKQIMLDRFEIEVEFGAGSIVYKETIAGPSYGIGHFEPLRHYAEVQVLVEPAEPGTGISFASMCSVDELDKNWQRLIQTHVEETYHPGVLTGSEATDLNIILMTGRAHPKHTEGGDFRQATYRAIRNALKNAQSVLLEPVYQFTMELPAGFIGRAMTDVERLHGKAYAPELSEDGEIAVLKGTAPVSTFWEYQKELTAYTAGRGSVSMVLHGYEPCHNQDEVVTARGYDSEADLRRPTGSVFCAHGAGYQVPWDEVVFYAHMECPISPSEMAGIRGLENYKRAGQLNNSDGMGADNFVTSVSNSQTGSHRERVISLEEIDSIFSAQHRNKKQEAASLRKRYKRTTASREVYGKNSSRGDVYGSGAGEKVYNKAARTLPKCILVDGYNMIHSWDELKVMVDTNMEGARGRLIDICSEYQGIVRCELILVFDAYLVSGGAGSITKQKDIYVVYTKEAETADQYIEQATKKKAKDYQVTVATSDQIEQLIVWSDGALRMSAPEFLQEIERARKSLSDAYLDKKGSVGNVIPLDNIKLD